MRTLTVLSLLVIGGVASAGGEPAVLMVPPPVPPSEAPSKAGPSRAARTVAKVTPSKAARRLEGKAARIEVHPPAVAPVAVEADEASTEASTESGPYEDEYSEPAVLRRKGIPQPPADARAYRAWRRSLPRSVRRTIDQHCREEGGNYQAVCNGIGPHAIPRPPRLTALNADAAIVAWRASLSAVQRRYADDYCKYKGDDDLWEAVKYSDLCGGTPIVLAFANERVAFTAASDGAATDWPTATTPWLTRDVDGDGAITHTGELFGSGTVLPDGAFARHGFDGLAALDANHDGVIDARDPAFVSLLVWADRDGDRASTPGELAPLSSFVESISLAYAREGVCDARGNCEGERAEFTWRDDRGQLHAGTAIDVYLRYR